jgi:hypothetical protein
LFRTRFMSSSSSVQTSLVQPNEGKRQPQQSHGATCPFAVAVREQGLLDPPGQLDVAVLPCSIDRSGYVRLVYAYRSGFPLNSKDSGAGNGLRHSARVRLKGCDM